MTEQKSPDAYNRFLNPSLAMDLCSKSAEHLWVALKPLQQTIIRLRMVSMRFRCISFEKHV